MNPDLIIDIVDRQLGPLAERLAIGVHPEPGLAALTFALDEPGVEERTHGCVIAGWVSPSCSAGTPVACAASPFPAERSRGRLGGVAQPLVLGMGPPAGAKGALT